MNKEKLTRIVKKLNAAVPGGFTCPICHARGFRLVDGFVSDVLSDVPGTIMLEGRSVTSVQLICSNCGFISQYALGVLDPEMLKSGGANDGEREG